MQEYREEYDICPYCGEERGKGPRELYFLAPGILVADRYEIGASIGSGGFGLTYKAWDRTLSKVVAVKEYYPAGMVNRVPGEKELIVYSGEKARQFEMGKARFLEEARNMARFSTHPNIINVYDFFEENSTAYIVMEYLDGENFKESLKRRGGKVPVEEGLQVARAVIAALSEVHKNGILHRDISPDNIFMCRDGTVKLIDFGAARFSAKDEDRTRSVILKPGFAPPEQYQTKSRQGPWTDIYALAATLYKAVTGTVPEESVNRAEEDLLEEPEKLCPDLPHSLSNAIMRAMALQYELRFQSAEEFGRALAGERSVRTAGGELRFRKLRRLASIAAVGVIVVFGIWLCVDVTEKRKAAAAVLDPAEISIWLCAPSEEEAQGKEDLLREALAGFQGDYPQIGMEIRCMGQEAYRDALRAALKQGAAPTLFDSSGLEPEDYPYLEDISPVFDFIRAGDYYFLDQYETLFPQKRQLPMAFLMPVAYLHMLADTEGRSVDELVEAGDFLVCREGFATWHQLYRTGAPGLDSLLSGEALGQMADREAFLSGEKACLIADTSLYSWVQGNLPGIYELRFFERDGMVGSLRDYFSISAGASADEKAAAVQVLVYLLADQAQDVCYVQNGESLPLNKKVYASYVDINKELKPLADGIPHVEMAGEKQALLDGRLEKMERGEAR